MLPILLQQDGYSHPATVPLQTSDRLHSIHGAAHHFTTILVARFGFVAKPLFAPASRNKPPQSHPGWQVWFLRKNRHDFEESPIGIPNTFAPIRTGQFGFFTKIDFWPSEPTSPNNLTPILADRFGLFAKLAFLPQQAPTTLPQSWLARFGFFPRIALLHQRTKPLFVPTNSNNFTSILAEEFYLFISSCHQLQQNKPQQAPIHRLCLNPC